MMILSAALLWHHLRVYRVGKTPDLWFEVVWVHNQLFLHITNVSSVTAQNVIVKYGGDPSTDLLSDRLLRELNRHHSILPGFSKRVHLATSHEHTVSSAGFDDFLKRLRLDVEGMGPLGKFKQSSVRISTEGYYGERISIDNDPQKLVKTSLLHAPRDKGFD